ncbi:UNVERIFIED_CONTAM: hypothetical protein BEN50_13170 [Euhalothece sp. KZN 001]
MTRKERLIQAIQQSSDEVVSELWLVFQELQVIGQQTKESELDSIESSSQRLFRKQGVLVIKTGDSGESDINRFINEMREERIQTQMGNINR